MPDSPKHFLIDHDAPAAGVIPADGVLEFDLPPLHRGGQIVAGTVRVTIGPPEQPIGTIAFRLERFEEARFRSFCHPPAKFAGQPFRAELETWGDK